MLLGRYLLRKENKQSEKHDGVSCQEHNGVPQHALGVQGALQGRRRATTGRCEAEAS